MLVAVLRDDNDGSVVVRDLAHDGLSTTPASAMSAPPALVDPAATALMSNL